MTINQELLEKLFEEAKVNPRLRTNLDLRTSAEDGSQRMLKAIEPGTEMPIHRHNMSSETCICIRGHFEEYLYDQKGNLLFVYAKTPDVENSNMYPYELRLWMDGKRLLRFSAKNHEGKEVYTGIKIPEDFQSEVNRVKERGAQLLEMFKGLDKAVLL